MITRQIHSRYRMIFLVALLATAVIHLLNGWFLQADGESLRNGVMVQTADDHSYLNPIDQWLEGGAFPSDGVDGRKAIVRSPGYGLLYGACRLIAGNLWAFQMIFLFQVVLFAFSAMAFAWLSGRLIGSGSIARFLPWLYALHPMFSGFLSYTLTEAVTPSLMIIAVALLVFGMERKQHKAFWLGSLVVGWMLLIRPPLIVFLPGMVYIVWWYGSGSRLRLIPLSVGIMVAPLLGWLVRNWIVFGAFMGLHPIYQNQLPGQFREPHRSVWEFHKTWESDGARFHGQMAALWEGAMDDKDPYFLALKCAEGLPAMVRETFGEERLTNAYMAYAEAIQAQRPWFEQRKLMPDTLLSDERHAVAIFKQLRKEMIQEHPTVVWIETPLRVGRRMVLHSNLSLYVFQVPLRGYWVMEGVRALSVGVHVLCLLAFFVFPFIRSQWRSPLMGLALCGVVYMLYLMFVQRGIEERYTLPLLGLGLLLMGRMLLRRTLKTYTKTLHSAPA